MKVTDIKNTNNPSILKFELDEIISRTENFEFKAILTEKGIIAEEACTLVLLGTGQY